jgi:uncharacterized membrane protein YhdT
MYGFPVIWETKFQTRTKERAKWSSGISNVQWLTGHLLVRIAAQSVNSICMMNLWFKILGKQVPIMHIGLTWPRSDVIFMITMLPYLVARCYCGRKLEHSPEGTRCFIQSGDVRYIDDSSIFCHLEGACRRFKAVNRSRTRVHELVQGVGLCETRVQRRSSEDGHVPWVLLGRLLTPGRLLAQGLHLAEVAGNAQVQIHLQRNW